MYQESNQMAVLFSIFYFVQYSVQIGDGYAVVGHWYALLLGSLDAVEYVFTVEHTSAAMDNEVVGGKIIGEIGSCNNVDGQFFTDSFA